MKRILIKISGEVLASQDGTGFGRGHITGLCKSIKAVVETGIGTSIIIGGGNIIRGAEYDESAWLRRETADSLGMLATVMNSILLRDLLTSIGVAASIVSSLRLPFDIESNDVYSVERLISQRRAVIFAGGVGLPYFSTDTMSVIAASMSMSDVILKATKTDGIYDKDPNKYIGAVYIPELTYQDALRQDLKIMDSQAFALAEQRKIPIRIFSMYEPNCFVRAINGEIRQSVVADGEGA
jgi:uridylate kinase